MVALFAVYLDQTCLPIPFNVSTLSMDRTLLDIHPWMIRSTIDFTVCALEPISVLGCTLVFRSVYEMEMGWSPASNFFFTVCAACSLRLGFLRRDAVDQHTHMYSLAKFRPSR